MALRVLFPAALVALALGCNQAPSSDQGAKPKATEAEASFGQLTVDEVAQRIDAAKAGKGQLFVYDNNQREVYEKGHVPTAKWVKPSALSASDLPADKAAPLVFYCANEQCSACHSGAQAAIALGYRNVFIMPEGIQGWQKAGKPLESARS